MQIRFLMERQEMGKKICEVEVNGDISPLRMEKACSGWRVVFRKDLHSPQLGKKVPGEQVLTPDLPFREAKDFVVQRVMFGGPEGLQPNPDQHFVLPTLERVMPESDVEGRCCP